ncbi:hypothetical protein [Streptomyces sp. NPDC056938]|uniref:hypothetical protein n=1 Tax=Streptomyces sp. NPDC056938 TaxID=3345970 RepID=UPI0036432D9B
MRIRAAAATAAMLLAALTACGGSNDKTDDKPADAKQSAKKVDCTDENLSQADWMKHCSDEDGGANASAGAEQPGKTLSLGTAAETIGAQSPAEGTGGGALEVTPTTVAYQAKAMGNEAQNGVFAIIAVKVRPARAAAATESAPIEGGGWQWIAPDGQALNEGENEASSITPSGFTGGGMVQAGSYKWRTIAFDLSEGQRGGTIVYTDGDGTPFRWKVPAKDAGPELAALKKGMAGNY